MKVTQESPDTFKPVTITLETREELDALRMMMNGIGCDVTYSDSTRDIADNLFAALNQIS